MGLAQGYSIRGAVRWWVCKVRFRPSQARVLPRLALSPAPAPPPTQTSTLGASPLSARVEGLIEIVLPGGVSVRVDAQVDGRALRRVLSAVENR